MAAGSIQPIIGEEGAGVSSVAVTISGAIKTIGGRGGGGGGGEGGTTGGGGGEVGIEQQGGAMMSAKATAGLTKPARKATATPNVIVAIMLKIPISIGLALLSMIAVIFFIV